MPSTERIPVLFAYGDKNLTEIKGADSIVAQTDKFEQRSRKYILSIDGSGEWATSLLGWGKGRQMDVQTESFFPDSLGLFYEAATQFCGFRPNYDEGKTMGLAPYGDSTRFYDDVASLVSVGPGGRIRCRN